ncbi:MAG: twin-arginine translocation signal domain-containing protein [Polyangiaceae bacterium]|nr:twin-arginine translocation signal domain-containing protein [Polyangiaceae bacterium]
MALTRRQFLVLVSVGTGVAACSAATPGTKSALTYRELHDGAGSAGTPSVLVCMPETPQTQEVWTGLSDEVASEYRLVAVRVEGRGSASLIAQGISRHRPSAVVLMNNPTVAAYREYLAQPGAARTLPAVVVMTSFLESQQLRALGAVGISYEVPLITVVTNLRRIVAAPVDRVGIVYRQPLQGFVQRQRGLAKRERISVVEQPVCADPNTSELKRAIRLAKQHSDAIWILNDDRLLTPELISEGWLPGLNEKPWRPTIVGAASLVSASQSFGTFAVLPDHRELGTQTANLLFEIADRGWALPPDPTTQLPLSTITTVDVVQARERFLLRRDALAKVDRTIE